MSGLGYHELWINGKKVGNNLLSPAQTDYEKRVFYLVHDLNDFIQPGANAIGVILGEGFYAQSLVIGRYGWAEKPYGNPKMMCQLEIDFDNGSPLKLLSDGTWQTTMDGPIQTNNVYAGESYDARKEILGWSKAGLDASSWKTAQITAPPGGKLLVENLEPIRIKREIKPIRKYVPSSGVIVYDLGENIAGWARLETEAPVGREITLRFAEEIAEDGNIDPDSSGVFATHHVQTDEYICKGNGVEVWEPRFTYHGFRYIEASGFEKEKEIKSILGIVLRSDLEKAGGFRCSDENLNNIYAMALRTLEGNLHGLPTDCPTREKCGWLGDAQLITELSSCNLHAPSFWTKFMQDIRSSALDGLPTNIVPGTRKCGISVPAWGCACVQIPWHLYLYYGDFRILQENYEFILNWLKYLNGKAEENILDHGLGDWCPPGSVRPTATPVALTSTAYYYYNTSLASQIAELLGHTKDSKNLNKKMKEIKKAFQNKFYHHETHSFGSQTGNAFALFLGLAPEGEEQKVVESLLKDIEEKEYHHTTGITGFKHLFNELSRHKQAATVMRLFKQTSYPGIGNLIAQGATTLWETWEKKPIDEPNPRSRNHPMQAAFASWFHQYLCGIRPSPKAPGYKHIIIEPCFPSEVSFAEAWQDTISGLIESSWKRNDRNEIIIDINIPPNCTGTLILPNAGQENNRVQEFKSGKHTIKIQE
jgi:alpha-L-rhamnosidase